MRARRTSGGRSGGSQCGRSRVWPRRPRGMDLSGRGRGTSERGTGTARAGGSPAGGGLADAPGPARVPSVRSLCRLWPPQVAVGAEMVVASLRGPSGRQRRTVLRLAGGNRLFHPQAATGHMTHGAVRRGNADRVALVEPGTDQMFTPRARSHGAGSTFWPPAVHTSKCRCGPVDWPRLPTSAICSPALTRSPTLTE